MIIIFGDIYSNINTDLDNTLLVGKKNTTTQDGMQGISGASAIHAISAARAGARVSMIGTIGNDLFGKHCLEIFRREGINSSGIAKSHAGTGLEFSFTDSSNKTTHITSIGANIHSHAKQIATTSLNERCLLMLSDDSDEQTIKALLDLAKERNSYSVLCLSNNKKIDESVYSLADIIITEKAAVKHDYGYVIEVKNSGINGAALFNKEENIYNYSLTSKSDAIDISACFDVFCGFFASALQAGLPIKRSIAFATKAAQKSSEKVGCYNSVPYLGYIQDLEKEEKKLLKS